MVVATRKVARTVSKVEATRAPKAALATSVAKAAAEKVLGAERRKARELPWLSPKEDAAKVVGIVAGAMATPHVIVTWRPSAMWLRFQVECAEQDGLRATASRRHVMQAPAKVGGIAKLAARPRLATRRLCWQTWPVPVT